MRIFWLSQYFLKCDKMLSATDIAAIGVVACREQKLWMWWRQPRKFEGAWQLFSFSWSFPQKITMIQCTKQEPTVFQTGAPGWRNAPFQTFEVTFWLHHICNRCSLPQDLVWHTVYLVNCCEKLQKNGKSCHTLPENLYRYLEYPRIKKYR